MFFHSRSRSREFLGMIASDSHSRIVGMDFFHSLPVPELWEWIFFIPFPFPNFGNRFFHSLPIPEFWEWFFFIPFPFPNWGNGFFQFPSRSRTLGMELSIPVPIPELPNVIPAHPWSELGAGKETKKTTSYVRFSKQLDGSTIPTSSNHDVYSSDHEMMQKKGGQTLCPKPISWWYTIHTLDKGSRGGDTGHTGTQLDTPRVSWGFPSLSLWSSPSSSSSPYPN